MICLGVGFHFNDVVTFRLRVICHSVPVISPEEYLESSLVLTCLKSFEIVKLIAKNACGQHKMKCRYILFVLYFFQTKQKLMKCIK